MTTPKESYLLDSAIHVLESHLPGWRVLNDGRLCSVVLIDRAGGRHVYVEHEVFRWDIGDEFVRDFARNNQDGSAFSEEELLMIAKAIKAACSASYQRIA